jgi:hypothetical protein
MQLEHLNGLDQRQHDTNELLLARSSPRLFRFETNRKSILSCFAQQHRNDSTKNLQGVHVQRSSEAVLLTLGVLAGASSFEETKSKCNSVSFIFSIKVAKAVRIARHSLQQLLHKIGLNQKCRAAFA